MSVESDFEDTVKTCEFYADPYYTFEVDFENYHIMVDGYGVDPVMEDGHLAYYLVEEPDGTTQFVEDLDHYFHRVFKWKEYL